MFVFQRIHSRHSRWNLFDQHMQQVACDVEQRLWQVRCEWFILQKEEQGKSLWEAKSVGGKRPRCLEETD